MFDLLSTLDADAASSAASRRSALRTAGQIGLGAAIASIPFLKPSAARAQAGGTTAFEVLNYALTLEYLERSFYRQALDMNYLAAARPLVETIEADETAHVSLLSGAITTAGGTPVVFDDADFAFGDFLASYDSFLALAQSLEDTGVRAYKGQAAAIQGTPYLTTALQIHSVEGRHAAAIRRLRGASGWIPLAQPGAPVPAVYGAGNGFPAEDNVTQGGVNLADALTGYTRQEITEAFDEGLDMQTVLGIADPFLPA